ncbi:MAG: UDP-2,3-diacylglucosamine diphosphatase [Gammaproteobacteria bacterium]|nr:MAG: UDP-2,3-diacylglucosamine diphosphatase [Gammaproteobacteria bacterium]
MTTLFISDLHLRPDNPDLIQLTVEFLKTETKDIEALYILGDLFNTWLGDDIVPSEYEPLINQLLQLHKIGIKTYLMVGNRDFMMGKDFAQRIGCELLNDACLINLYGTNTLLLHGDTLCIDDIAYQRYRRWARNKIIQWCFLKLPTSYRQSISDKIKQKSRKNKENIATSIMDVNQTEVERVMTQFEVAQLIHGHTHRPAIHTFSLAGQFAKRIVLGDWNNKSFSVLRCNKNEMKLIDPRVINQVV